MGLFGGLAKTVTGVAKQATGGTAAFRKVLEMNPSALSFALPPQVQIGLKVANQLGLKLPTEEQITGKVNTLLQKNLKGLQREVSGAIGGTGLLDKVDAGAKTVNEVLNKIDWLL